MNIPAILQGEVHLPLSDGMTSSTAVPLANQFYQTDLNADDFKLSQAFRVVDGQLHLELISIETGEVAVTFVNKSQVKATTTNEAGEWIIDNPLMTPAANTTLLTSPVAIFSATELDFLDALGSGNTYATEGTDNTVAWKLANLLNSYNVLSRWVSGTIGEYSVGGFKLVYKGPASGAPQEFRQTPTDMLAIIEILHGDNKGFLCLRT